MTPYRLGAGTMRYQPIDFRSPLGFTGTVAVEKIMMASDARVT